MFVRILLIGVLPLISAAVFYYLRLGTGQKENLEKQIKEKIEAGYEQGTKAQKKLDHWVEVLSSQQGAYSFAGRPLDLHSTRKWKVLENQFSKVGWDIGNALPLWICMKIEQNPTPKWTSQPVSEIKDSRVLVNREQSNLNQIRYKLDELIPSGVYFLKGVEGKEAGLSSQRVWFSDGNLRFKWATGLQSSLSDSIKEGKVYLIVGCIPDLKIKGKAEAIYRIILNISNDRFESNSMLYENDQKGKGEKVSIDKIESILQVDFFPRLNEELEKELESSI